MYKKLANKYSPAAQGEGDKIVGPGDSKRMRQKANEFLEKRGLKISWKKSGHKYLFNK